MHALLESGGSSGSAPPLLSRHEWDQVMQQLELSPRQVKIAELILRGKRDKEIAAELGLSYYTVRTYLSRIFNRLGVASRVELTMRVSSDCMQFRSGHGVPERSDTGNKLLPHIE